MLEKLVRLAI